MQNEELFISAMNGEGEKLQSLLNAKANVNVKLRDGLTPLHLASQNGHVECVQLLLGAKADVHVTAGENKNTPLHLASKNGHVKCVQLLLGAKASEGAALTNGAKPLHSASQNGHAKCVQLLLDANKSNVNTEMVNGITPLLAAVERGHAECVKLLVNANADLEKVSNGGAALFYAAYRGDIDCMRVLLEAKANVDVRATREGEEGGTSPLFIAAGLGHEECVQLLLSANADVNAARMDGATPVIAAAKASNANCVALLYNHLICDEVDDKEFVKKAVNSIVSQQGCCNITKSLIKPGEAVTSIFTAYDGKTFCTTYDKNALRNWHYHCANEFKPFTLPENPSVIIDRLWKVNEVQCFLKTGQQSALKIQNAWKQYRKAGLSFQREGSSNDDSGSAPPRPRQVTLTVAP